MLKRFVNLAYPPVLLTLILGVVLFTSDVSFGADAYSIPQTAEVRLTWDHNDSSPEGYRIYQRTEGQSYDYSQPCWTGPGTEGIVYNLISDTIYYFVVRAYDGALESADSEEVEFISPSVNRSVYRQWFSNSSDRSNPEALDGETVDGLIYAFVKPTTDIKRVEFFIDGVLRQTENYAPYDLSGGSPALAKPFDTSALNKGPHTISAQITRTDGSRVTTAAEVIVGGSDAIEVKYSISPRAGENGLIIPGSPVVLDEGGRQSFTITGKNGYQIADVLVDGKSIGAVSSYTFNQVFANHTISANFAIDGHTISASAGVNGTITPAGSVSMDHRTGKTYTITPNPGYQVADVLVDGVSIGATSSYSFSQMTANHTIHATFTAATFAITATEEENGNISPSGTVDVTFGGSQTFTFTADTGFHIADVQIDGQSMGGINTYTFSRVEQDHTLAVTFAENTVVKVWIEAEDGDMYLPMEIADDGNASAGGFVWVPEETGSLTGSPDNRGYAEYYFEVPENGDFGIWGRQISNDSASDSFFVSVDGKADLVWHTKPGGLDVWTWDVMSIRNAGAPRGADAPERFRLTAGAHTLRIKQREDGTKLDRLLITNEPNPSFYELVMSTSPNRSAATLLDGAEIGDNLYAFVEPATDIKRVEFFIDGVLRQTENLAPYDLGGGRSDSANPFDTRSLCQGLHTFSAQITMTDGNIEIIDANVTISNSKYRQWFSRFSDRSTPDALDGETVDGLVYAFVEPITDIKRVEFFIDGALHQIENYAPYDLSGGSAEFAMPFDTRELSKGPHTFSAQITTVDGSRETITAGVNVDNPNS